MVFSQIYRGVCVRIITPFYELNGSLNLAPYGDLFSIGRDTFLLTTQGNLGRKLNETVAREKGQ